MSRRTRARNRRRVWRRWILLFMLAVGAFLAIALLRPQWFLAGEYARLRLIGGATESVELAAGHRWSVLEAGRGRSVILIHGFTGSKENWLPVFSSLSEHYRVVAPDLPGWGSSERKIDEDYGFSAQAERLALWLQLQPESTLPVTLVGHSMGGGIAALLAARHPELVEKLVLVDAAGVRFDDNDFSRAVARGDHPFEVIDRASLDNQLALVFENPPWVPWPADQALIAQRRADRAYERRVLASFKQGPEALLPGIEAISIRAPTLLLWCRNDRIVDVSGARRYAGRIANSRTVLLDECNHMPMMEQPAATAAALRQFIDQ